MALLRVAGLARVLDSFPLRWSSAQAAASTPEESYDTASPFRGRIFRPRAGCCNTSERPARDARPDLRLLRRGLILVVRRRNVSRRGAGGQVSGRGGKKGRPIFPPR